MLINIIYLIINEHQNLFYLIFHCTYHTIKLLIVHFFLYTVLCICLVIFNF